MARDITIKVRVKNLTMKGLGAARASIRQFVSFSGRAFKGAAAVGAAAFLGLGKAVKTAFKFETFKTQFTTLLGSAKEAQVRINEIRELAKKTPFQLDELVRSSKQLQQFGYVGEENIAMLKKLGDTAASLDPEKLEEMAFAFGRLRAGASAGLVGEPTMRLLELGVISASTKDKMEELAKSTKDVDAVLALLSKELEKYGGGMERLATTGGGLFSTFLDTIEDGFLKFGDVLMDFSKNTLKEATAAIDTFTSSDTFKQWAEGTADALATAKSLIKDFFSGNTMKRQQAAADFRSIFSEAAEAAAKILIDAAINMGRLIAEGAKMAVGAGGPKKRDRDAAMKALGIEQEYDINVGASGGSVSRRALSASDQAALDEKAMEIFKERLAREMGIQVGRSTREIMEERSDPQPELDPKWKELQAHMAKRSEALAEEQAKLQKGHDEKAKNLENLRLSALEGRRNWYKKRWRRYQQYRQQIAKARDDRMKAEKQAEENATRRAKQVNQRRAAAMQVNQAKRDERLAKVRRGFRVSRRASTRRLMHGSSGGFRRASRRASLFATNSILPDEQQAAKDKGIPTGAANDPLHVKLVDGKVTRVI